MIAHHSITSAVAIALDIQHQLHHFDWGTTKINDIYTELTDLKQQRNTNHNRNVWNGLRIRVGIAYGLCDGQIDPITGGWDYYGTTVNTAARVEAVAHGGQVVLTGPAYQALLQQQRKCSLDANPIPLPDTTVQEKIGMVGASTHGPVCLRGLRERIPLVEIWPRGFTERKFPPLRLGDAPECAEPTNSLEEGAGAAIFVDPDLPHDEQDHLLAGLSPDRRMEHMMKICMRDAGLRKYDSTLLEASWSIFLSLKAMLSLHSPEERDQILSDWTKRWHLSVPLIHPAILKTVGGDDIPKLLMLSARAATVVLAEKQPLLDTASSSNHSVLLRDFPTSVSARSLPARVSSRSLLAFTQQQQPTRSFAPFIQQQSKRSVHFLDTSDGELEPTTTTEHHYDDDTSLQSSSSC